jgi:hypothetical protein
VKFTNRVSSTAPNVAPDGAIEIEVRCWLNPQLERLKKNVAAAIRAMMLNQFRFIVTPGTE